MLRELRAASPQGEVRTPAELKELLRDQVALLRLDQERAVQGIARMLPHDAEKRKAVWAALQRLVAARTGVQSEASQQRLARVEALFAGKSKPRVGASDAAAVGHQRARHRTREVSAPH
jgi:hypothetical protein